MGKYNKYSYYLCFALSFIAHFAIFKGMDFFFNPVVPKILPPHPMPKVTLQFVDTYKNENNKTKEPSDLISDKNTTASQPKKPKEPVDDKSSPYKEKITDNKQIATAPATQKSGQAPQLMPPVPPLQSPQINDVKATEVKKEEKNFIKDDVIEEHEQTVYKQKTVIDKTTEAPSEIEKKQVDRKTDITPKESIAPQQPIAADGGYAPSDVTSYEAKIDEFMNKAQTDLKSIAEVTEEFNFYTVKHGLSEYFAKMKKIIRRNWVTRMTVNYSTEMFSSEASVIFKILANGEIGYMKTVYSDGNPFFVHDCEMSITEKGKYDPLPENYVRESGKNYYWIIINFGYNNKTSK